MTIRRQRRAARRGAPKNNQMAGRLPRNAPPVEVTINHIGGRGDGVGRVRYTHNYQDDEHDVFVPASLPGETLLVQPLSLTKQGMKARIIELKNASADRETPRCNAFPACGGCSFQHWNDANVGDWKQDLLAHFLARAGVTPTATRPPHISPPHSRRRASFHLKCLANRAVVGFSERLSQHIVSPDGCVVLHPRLVHLRQHLEDEASARFPAGFTADVHVNLLFGDDGGDGALCVYINSAGKSAPLSPPLFATLTTWAAAAELGRLTIDDAGGPLTLYAPATPATRFGPVLVSPPAGCFLQATVDGETALQNAVAEILGDARRVIDLFAGCGTLGLPCIDRLATLCAVESDAAALRALKAGADASGFGGRVKTLTRNLFEAPMLAKELSAYDAVILDPPRSGAAAQCQELAKTDIGRIAMVSCNPASFARDAAILTAGGFTLDWVQMIDQFRFSNHLELVGAFIKQA
jgi:23S rRNA (uracil1939-C5)-methyltransferase